MLTKVFFLVIFFGSMIAVGISSRKHATNVNDFVLGGRSVGPWLTAFAYGTSYFSAVVFVGYAGQFGSKYGLASLGMYVQNLDTYEKQAQYYGEEIKRIQEMLADDKYNKELIEQLHQYEDVQKDALVATEEQKKAIVDLAKQGYQALADSLSDVIDKYKEMLLQCEKIEVEIK